MKVEIKRKDIPTRLKMLERLIGIKAEVLNKEHPSEIIKMFEQCMKKKDIDNIIPTISFEDPTVDEIKTAIDLAIEYVKRNSKYIRTPYGTSSYRIPSEYPGVPVSATYTVGTSVIVHPLGWWGYDRGVSYSKIHWSSIGSTYALMDVGFEDTDRSLGESPDYDYNEPYLWVDRYYTDSGVTYEVSFRYYDGVRTANVYLGPTYLFTVNASSPVTTVEVSGMFPSHRYTIRHCGNMARFLYRVIGYNNDANGIDDLRSQLGFTIDLYDPLFQPVNELLYVLNYNTLYRDCDVYSTMPVGINTYPYRSRVCCGTSIYAGFSLCECLVNMVYAINALLIGYGANSSIPDLCSTFVQGIPSTTTPHNIAETCWNNLWNGYGFGYPTNTSVANSIRTNLALALYTLLFWKTQNRYYKNKADQLANWVYLSIVKQPSIPTTQGTYTRPQHVGGQLVFWVSGSAVYKPQEETIFDQIFGAVCPKMPSEDADIIPTNMESTMTAIQSLRIYLKYVHNVTYPNNLYIP